MASFIIVNRDVSTFFLSSVFWGFLFPSFLFISFYFLFLFFLSFFLFLLFLFLLSFFFISFFFLYHSFLLSLLYFLANLAIQLMLGSNLWRCTSRFPWSLGVPQWSPRAAHGIFQDLYGAGH